jgi:uncharacterized protein YndB with AHSA1/START domain
VATNRRIIDAAPEAVWQVLADGHSYKSWVVGTSKIRAVDAAWPAPGSRLHYRVGRGPLRHDGHTEVLSVADGWCLELEAHAWPLGTARIELRLEQTDDGRCGVTMVEHPARGTAAALHNPLGDALLKLRNVEALRRLEKLAAAVRR